MPSQSFFAWYCVGCYATLAGTDIAHRLLSTLRSQRQYGQFCSLGGKKRRETTLSFVVMVVFVGSAIAMAVVGSTSSRQDWMRFHCDDWWPSSLGWVGLVLGTFSTLCFIYTHVAMGWSWTPMVEEKFDHELRTDGPYKFARHPMYSSLLGMPLATLCLTQSWWFALAIAVLLVWPVHRYRQEERVMLGLFGDTYAEYMRQVGPFVWFAGRSNEDYISWQRNHPETCGESTSLINDA
eukprot:m.146655 g.146655  ORF g.146655 m.146655 type:complete len:237 (+) comp17261_c0_seq1:358-1068(+)